MEDIETTRVVFGAVSDEWPAVSGQRSELRPGREEWIPWVMQEEGEA